MAAETEHKEQAVSSKWKYTLFLTHGDGSGFLNDMTHGSTLFAHHRIVVELRNVGDVGYVEPHDACGHIVRCVDMLRGDEQIGPFLLCTRGQGAVSFQGIDAVDYVQIRLHGLRKEADGIMKIVLSVEILLVLLEQQAFLVLHAERHRSLAMGFHLGHVDVFVRLHQFGEFDGSVRPGKRFPFHLVQADELHAVPVGEIPIS